MSNTALSNTQELIERSLFEVIRKELVDKGYIPDITLFADDETGYDLYQAAVQTIVQNKGYSIELYNEGSNAAKGIKKTPRIVINTGNFLPGALGGDPQRIFQDQGLYYQALITPPQTVDFFINIHLVSADVEQERILNSLLSLAIQRRSYIPFYSDPNETFFCRYLNFFQMDDMNQGIMEKVYAYVTEDCYDTEDRVIMDNIAKLTQISLHPNIQKYLDGEWGSTDTDPIVVEYTPRGEINGEATVTGTLST